MYPPLCINTKRQTKDSKGMKCYNTVSLVTILLNASLLSKISQTQLPPAQTDSPAVGHEAAV